MLKTFAESWGFSAAGTMKPFLLSSLQPKLVPVISQKRTVNPTKSVAAEGFSDSRENRGSTPTLARMP